MPTLLNDVEIFRVGEYPQGTYTTDDIDEIVSNYDPDFFESPTSIDHVQEGPALGWVKQLRRQGDLMLADVEVSDELADALKEKKFANRSVEIARLPEKGKYLKALTFLGVKVPQVKGLKPIDFSTFEDEDIKTDSFDLTSPSEQEPPEEPDVPTGSSSFLQFAGQVLSNHLAETDERTQFGEELGNFLREKRDELELTNADLAEAAGIAESTVQGILSGDIDRPPDNRLEGFASLIDVSVDELKGMLEQLNPDTEWFVETISKKFMDLEAEAEQARERMDSLMVERRRNDFESFLNEIVSAGHLAPAAREGAMQILQALDNVPARFAEQQETAPVEQFKEFLQSLPKQFHDNPLLGGNSKNNNKRSGDKLRDAVEAEQSKSLIK